MRPAIGIIIMGTAGWTLGAAGAASAEATQGEGTRNAAVEAACPASFPARLADARRAIKAEAAYTRDYNRVMPWYLEHCRALSPLEIAIRKIDDPWAFVCEKAPGRPAGLTPKFVREHNDPPGVVADFQTQAEESQACAKVDPVSLDLRSPTEPDEDEGKRVHQLWQLRGLARKFEVLCYDAKGAKAATCAKERDDTAKLEAALVAEIAASAGNAK